MYGFRGEPVYVIAVIVMLKIILLCQRQSDIRRVNNVLQ